MLYTKLNPEKALIWRIVHRDNLPWILDNGLYCGNSVVKAPDWISIGNPELIDKRARHPVPLPPGGWLNDYVPFYFTPFSPMLRNIHTAWGGIQKRSNEEIVILVSSLPHIAALGLPFLFTDSHAYYQWATLLFSVGRSRQDRLAAVAASGLQARPGRSGQVRALSGRGADSPACACARPSGPGVLHRSSETWN